MNQHLQKILNLLQQDNSLSAEEKMAALKSLKDADKEMEIANFKLDRTEKVKRTTAILLEETIQELEQKRKAVEEQNTELAIESSLERVRTFGMSMAKPDDLMKICETMYHELKKLGFADLRNTMINIHYDEKSYLLNYDFAENTGRTVTSFVYNSHPIVDNIIQHAKQSSERFTEMIYSGKTLDDLRAFRKNNGEADDARLDSIDALCYYFYSIGTGAIGISMFNTANQQQLNVLKRFRNVFDLAYKRYIDITNAVAQAKESQIQLALERVRARTMAMQKSDELPEAANLLFQQLQSLGMPAWSAGYCTWNEDKTAVTLWMSSEGVLQPPFTAPTTEDQLFIEMRRGQEDGKTFHVVEMGGEKLVKHYQYMRTLPLMGDILDSIIAAGHPLPSFQIMHHAYFSKGFLLFITYEPVPDAHDIFKRFGKVFDQTYTRFLDLQKAEAQAKESQIEAALERVRSRTMGMQKSEELKEIIKVVYEQMVHLKIPVEHAGFIIDYKERDDMLIWLADQRYIPSQITIPYFDSPHWNSFKEAKEKGMDFFVNQLSFEEKNKFYTDLFKLFPVPDDAKEYYFSCSGLAISTVLLDDIGLYIENFSGNPYTDEENSVLMRFGKVFQQTYTRFNDLEKAEVQAREAQVQLALERVRARTMAMQHSDELADASFVLDTQVRSLGIKTRGCAFNIYGDNESLEWFSSEQGSLPMYKTPRENLFLRYFEKGLSGVPLYIEEFTGDVCAAHYEYLCTVPIMGDALRAMLAAGGSFPTRQIDHVTYHKYGYLLFITLEPQPEAHDIFIRFAKVFEQTYTRFLDLKKAEAQAKEAQIESALERVRSRTLAMQKSEELPETAAVLFQQLIALGIEPNRLYITIIKGDNGETEFWITDEDGTKVSTAFAANMNDNSTFLKMYEGWKQQLKSMVIDTQGEELQNYFRHLTSLGVPFKGGLQQKRRVQDIAYFSRGFIGMASPDEQPAETLQLLERFAAVFNLTFTRFNDLKIAEAHAIQAEKDLIAIKEAKQKAEEALTELQTTQKQLIQSEKMASLGELTAGIAHEIQNPLNFVNNFSEVSKELLDEMRAAIEKGDAEETKEIMNDLIQNLEKINHHGKRADGIVKGMLQHSQNSGTVKEPTDINALADEYLRLAYHGLRAKDKLFNATIKTDFDKSIGTINIIPPDISRVILNIVTNAFYAVNEKKKEGDKNYEPVVSVSTQKKDIGICISIKDNGNGIPGNIIDKIFQPFFTTKPTGQGTGLGLSLAYDIVKAHGGDITVKTNQNDGTTFIIHLPISLITN